MSQYKFTDKKRNVVFKIDEDGKSRVSFLIGADGQLQQEYKNWLEKGNETLQEDPAIEPKPKTTKEKLNELGISLKDLKQLLKDEPGA